MIISINVMSILYYIFLYRKIVFLADKEIKEIEVNRNYTTKLFSLEDCFLHSYVRTKHYVIAQHIYHNFSHIVS